MGYPRNGTITTIIAAILPVLLPKKARTGNKHNMETGTLLYIYIIENLGTEH
jgi:hypothetical protein